MKTGTDRKFDLIVTSNLIYTQKGPVKLIQWVKIAHAFLQSVSYLFHFII